MHKNDLVACVLLCALLLSACTPATPTPASLPVHEDERIIPFRTIDIESRSPLPPFVGVPEVQHDEQANSSNSPLPTPIPDEELPGVSQLYLVDSVEAIDPLIGLLPAETIRGLYAIDFERSLVFALLRGVRYGSRPATYIERISLGEGGIRIYAQFWVPSSNEGDTEDFGYFPYHVVKVLRDDIYPSPYKPSVWNVDLLARLCDNHANPCN